jgi:2,3-bisphosphoglycerate-dependent phosphoglycerate mutase
MRTYLVRHARTRLSASYRVNGDPSVPVALDDVGIKQCAQLSERALWLKAVNVCVTSRFARAAQTADLLLGDTKTVQKIDHRLDEIRYGDFEGCEWRTYGAWLGEHGPAAVPPGGDESWLMAADRLLAGLGSCLAYPSPRLVVGHGILVSLVQALLDGVESLACDALPEAPYVSPMVLPDDVLAEVVDRGRRLIRQPGHQ